MKIALCVLILVQTLFADKENTEKKYENITTVYFHSMAANVRIKVHNQTFVQVDINGSNQEKEAIKVEQKDNDLTISSSYNYPDNTRGTSYVQITVLIPETCRVAIDLKDRSHAFIGKINESIKATLTNTSEITIDECTGLVLKQDERSKSHIKRLNGNLLVEAKKDSGVLIDEGEVETALLDIKASVGVFSHATHKSLKLKTNGRPKIDISKITKTFQWSGRADEKIHIGSLSGTAEIMASYGSEITIDHADIETLYASTAASGKIYIKGKVAKAFCSTRGLGTIDIEEVTELLKITSESKKGPITIGKKP